MTWKDELVRRADSPPASVQRIIDAALLYEGLRRQTEASLGPNGPSLTTGAYAHLENLLYDFNAGA